MPAASHVLLLRHAATAWNDEKRRQGWADEPLTAGGVTAAHLWARACRGPFDLIFSSDLQRARDTARIIAGVLGLESVVEIAGFREQDQGAWTGLTKHQIKDRWPERLRERPRRPVGGETSEQVRARVLAALGAIAAAHGGCRLLVVTHSGVIRTLEQSIDAESLPVSHLEGRWLNVSPGTSQAEPLLTAGSGTPGRPSRVLLGANTPAEG